MSFSVLRLCEIEDISLLQTEIDSIVQNTWPTFLLHDTTLIKYFEELMHIFPKYQFCVQENGIIVGIGNCLPLSWTGNIKKLPDAGWSWALEKGINDNRDDIPANTLAALSITVNPTCQGRGISTLIIKEIKKMAKTDKLSKIIVPIRPTQKDRYPLTPINEYIAWERKDGQAFDPWIRIHQRLGAKVVKICLESMRVTGTIAEWERWTQMKFFDSAKYIVPGALNPIDINVEKDIGEYVEPNVWMVYE